MKYLHCPRCVDEGKRTGKRGLYDIAVDDYGDLLLLCRAHEDTGPFMRFRHGEIEVDLARIAGAACDGCGETHEGETH